MTKNPTYYIKFQHVSAPGRQLQGIRSTDFLRTKTTGLDTFIPYMRYSDVFMHNLLLII